MFSTTKVLTKDLKVGLGLMSSSVWVRGLYEKTFIKGMTPRGPVKFSRGKGTDILPLISFL